jgi:hypothetical protein
VAVVEQLPRGGGDVTIGRTCYHARVHLAILRICDTRALDAVDRGALMARHGLLFMDPIAFCLYEYASGSRSVCTIRVVLWLVYV